MRIESHGGIPAGINGMTGDLVSRLEKGDVIRAKVLETSPGEVVMRLSDGTVLKASTAGEHGFEAGDMVTLGVKGRTGTRIILEIVSDQISDGRAGSSRLMKLLGSMGLEPDKTNLELASEFLQFKTRPTAEDMAKALELLRNSPAMDPEKAAYIVSNKIDLSRFDNEMFSRFLDGELKLGQLLESLAKALDRASADRGSSAGAAVPATDRSYDTAQENAYGSAYDPAYDISKETAVTDVSGHETYQSQATRSPDETLRVFQNSPAGEADMPDNDATTRQVTGSSVKEALSDEHVAAGRAEDVTLGNLQNFPHDSGNFSVRDPGNIPVQDTGGFPVIQDEGRTDLRVTEKGSADSDKQGDPGAWKDGMAKGLNGDAPSAGRLKEHINDLFVTIRKNLSVNDIDADKMKERLAVLLAETEDFLRSSQAAVSDAAVNVSRSMALLGETVKTMDLLNSFNIFYCQIPVNLNGNMGTAELYIMKRRQNRKRIDPHDAVIFLSLDTHNMGRVEALLDIKGNGVSIDLRTESADVSDFIKSNINSLYSGISECGYKLVNVTYSVIDAPADITEQEKLLAAKANYSHAKIDYRI